MLLLPGCAYSVLLLKECVDVALRLAQVEGVRWLFKLHTLQSGGILGDSLYRRPVRVCSHAPVATASVEKLICTNTVLSNLHILQGTTWGWGRPCSALPSSRGCSTAALSGAGLPGMLQARHMRTDEQNARMRQRHSHVILLSHILAAQSVTCLAWPRRRTLVVAPKTLLAHWAAELCACGLGRLVAEFYGGSARERCASFSCTSKSHACQSTTVSRKEAVELAISTHQATANPVFDLRSLADRYNALNSRFKLPFRATWS